MNKLRTGRVVQEPWLETDYVLEGVQVETEDDIEQLKRIAKHMFVTAAEDIGTDSSATRGKRSVSTSNGLAADREARIIHGATKVVIDEVHENMRAGRAVDTNSAREVITQITASVARHPDAPIWFTNLKNREQYTAE